ncbi:MAG TPA: HAMP domain-containing sensor histidine kinase [Actinomycetota bacterium]
MTSWVAFVLGLLAGIIAAIAVVAVRRRTRAGPSRAASSPAPTGTAERAEIASKVAHELKNPIMSVKGLASTGARLYESMSDEERLEFFQLIDREADRLKVIADETSTAMKIDAGQLTYVMRPEDLGKLVEEVAWHAPVGDHPMVVETEAGLITPIDRIRISEVLANLIDNAAKYSPPGSPIEVRAYRGGPKGSAVVEVADRGPGIPPEQREVVFAKFATHRPPGYEETPGAGLGLFICRAHVLAHGGRLDIEGQAGQGTMLRVTLQGG